MPRPNFFYRSLQILSGLQDERFDNEIALRYFQFRYYLSSSHGPHDAYRIAAAYFGSLVMDFELAQSPGKNAASRIIKLLKSNEKRLMYNSFFSREGFNIANRFDINSLTDSEFERRELDKKHKIDLLDIKLALAVNQIRFGFDSYKKLQRAGFIRGGITDFTFRRVNDFLPLKTHLLYAAKRMYVDLSLLRFSTEEFMDKHNRPMVPDFEIFRELFSKASYLNHMLGGPSRRHFDTMIGITPIKIDPIRAFSDVDLAVAGLGRRKWKRKWDLPPTLSS